MTDFYRAAASGAPALRFAFPDSASSTLRNACSFHFPTANGHVTVSWIARDASQYDALMARLFLIALLADCAGAQTRYAEPTAHNFAHASAKPTVFAKPTAFNCPQDDNRSARNESRSDWRGRGADARAGTDNTGGANTRGTDRKSTEEPQQEPVPQSCAGAYAVLGLPPETSLSDVTRTYRKLALQRHPDKPGGSTEAFQQLENAYTEVKAFHELKERSNTPAA